MLFLLVHHHVVFAFVHSCDESHAVGQDSSQEVYLKDYEEVPQAKGSLAKYFAFYNEERPHQALDYRTPAEAYFGRGEGGAEESTQARTAAVTPVALRAPSVTAIQETETILI